MGPLHAPAHKQRSGDQTLADYIERKTPEKKLTFDEWWASPAGQALSPWGAKSDFDTFKLVWQSAQANV